MVMSTLDVSITNRLRYVLFVSCFMNVVWEVVSEVAFLLQTCPLKLNRVLELVIDSWHTLHTHRAGCRRDEQDNV
jgi:hypothetical protein